MPEPKPFHAPADPRDLIDDYRPTRLIELPALARLARIAQVFVKIEADRPLGNFKMLGGMFASLQALARAAQRGGPLPTLICASDGNHGSAVATAARRAGTRARTYLPAHASRVRVERIEAAGARVVSVNGTYDDAVLEAAAAAKRREGLLISDTSDDPDDLIVGEVMQGYALITRELQSQFTELRGSCTHAFVQAGVGGLAAAIAAGSRGFMRSPARLMVVEPEAAACVARALEVGRAARISGDLHTSAEMLSCGQASAPALKILQRHGAQALSVGEDELRNAVQTLWVSGGPHTTPSGAAGLAGLLHVAQHDELRTHYQIAPTSAVLLIATEGPAA